MRFDFPFVDVLTIPTGATTGTRIVIDGVNGTITGYDSTNTVVFEITGLGAIFGNTSMDAISLLNGVLTLYAGGVIIGTLDENGFTFTNPFDNSTVTIGPGPAQSTTPISAVTKTTFPATTSIPTPSTTPAGSNDLELRWASTSASNASNATFTSPATYTEREDATIDNSLDSCSASLATKALSSGSATGIQNFTASTSQNVSIGVTVDVKSSSIPASYRDSTVATASGTTSFTCTAPTLVAGDVLVAFQTSATRQYSTTAISNAMVTPSGWSLLTSNIAQYGDVPFQNMVCKVWWRQAGSSEPANYTFTSVGDPFAANVVAIASIQNAESSSPPGITFSDDTNLYRSAANTLKTDDTFIAATDIQVEGPVGTLNSVSRGIIAQQTLTANSSTFTTDSATDMFINNVPVVAGRTYAVSTNALGDFTAAVGSWELNLQVNGTYVGTFARVINETATAARHSFNGTVYWVAPTTQSTDDFTVQADERTGTADLTLVGGTTETSPPRTLTIIDVGVL